MNKGKMQCFSIIGIVLLLFNIISFTIPFKNDGVFWMSYGFAMIAIFLQILVIKQEFSRSMSLKSKLYGVPVLKVSFVYLAIQMVISILAMLCSRLLSTWTVMVVYSFILGIAVILFICVDAMRDEAIRREEELDKLVYNMYEMQSKMKILEKQCEKTIAFKQVEELSEKIKYSDPVSCEATMELEYVLKMYINEIQVLIDKVDYEPIVDICKKIEVMLEERNIICQCNR